MWRLTFFPTLTLVFKAVRGQGTAVVTSRSLAPAQVNFTFQYSLLCIIEGTDHSAERLRLRQTDKTGPTANIYLTYLYEGNGDQLRCFVVYLFTR